MTAGAVQQQQSGHSAPAPSGDAWANWPAETIASILGSPLANVQANWSLLVAALTARGIGDRPVQIAALATIAIETASTFAPVREAFWLDEAWRRSNLRYYPWYGRGFVQLTWQSNYATYGRLIGVDLIADPDRAMDPAVAAEILAEYFVQADVVSAARTQDWAEVRRRVQGAYAGLDRLLGYVQALEGS